MHQCNVIMYLCSTGWRKYGLLNILNINNSFDREPRTLSLWMVNGFNTYFLKYSYYLKEFNNYTVVYYTSNKVVFDKVREDS